MPTLQAVDRRDLFRLVALTMFYVVAGLLGLRLAFSHPSATPVWAPTGIALAAFLLYGLRVWPAILLGAFTVNVLTEGTILTSLGIAVGNTLEGVIGARLVTRWAGGRRAFEHARTAVGFVLLATSVGPGVSATIGVTSLALGNSVPWWNFVTVWTTWWIGDATGAVVFTPPLLLWAVAPRPGWDAAKAGEAIGLGVAVLASGFVVFGSLLPLLNPRSPSEFLTTPVIMWAAFRFGPREAATSVLVLSGIAVFGTLSGHGPFVVGTPNESLLLLQGFMGVAAASTLIVAAAMTERRAMERQLREWSTSDPLTGLANYRQLIAVLEGELRRYQRTERPFAFVLLDLDGLKAINDRHGHLVGSRALTRVAEALRLECRSIDTAARFGGDEFAVVLPEADTAAARHLTVRIAERLANDPEQPPISACTGVAICPTDGATAESIIRHADGQLYAAKRHHGRTTPTDGHALTR